MHGMSGFCEVKVKGGYCFVGASIRASLGSICTIPIILPQSIDLKNSTNNMKQALKERESLGMTCVGRANAARTVAINQQGREG